MFCTCNRGFPLPHPHKIMNRNTRDSWRAHYKNNKKQEARGAFIIIFIIRSLASQLANSIIFVTSVFINIFYGWDLIYFMGVGGRPGGRWGPPHMCKTFLCARWASCTRLCICSTPLFPRPSLCAWHRPSERLSQPGFQTPSPAPV